MKNRKVLGIFLLCFACSWSLAQSGAPDESNSITPPITGTGSRGHIAAWASTTNLVNSNIFQSTAGSTNGFIGIGTTAPLSNLHIVGGENTNVTVESSVANGNPGINVIANTPAGLAYFNLSRADGGASASIFLATDQVADWFIEVPVGDTDQLNISNGSHTPAVTFLQAGQMGIGTQTPTNLLTLVEGGGPALADGWSTYSSRRFKTNIHPLLGALEKVEQLQGVSYDRKSDGKSEIGVVAEEVDHVVPEVVSRDPKTHEVRGVDYSRLSALLIEAVKSQQAEIEELKEQLQALKK